MKQGSVIPNTLHVILYLFAESKRRKKNSLHFCLLNIKLKSAELNWKYHHAECFDVIQGMEGCQSDRLSLFGDNR